MHLHVHCRPSLSKLGPSPIKLPIGAQTPRSLPPFLDFEPFWKTKTQGFGKGLTWCHIHPCQRYVTHVSPVLPTSRLTCLLLFLPEGVPANFDIRTCFLRAAIPSGAMTFNLPSLTVLTSRSRFWAGSNLVLHHCNSSACSQNAVDIDDCHNCGFSLLRRFPNTCSTWIYILYAPVFCHSASV